jgi:GNAT superfamily N-acetyltransferase
MKMKIEELTPDLWPDLERLFGSKGACGGCWCMVWRRKIGEKWEAVKGEENRRRFRALVKGGKAHGALAYADGEPIGWVSFDRRVDYDKLNRSPSMACEDAEKVWSVPCFFILPAFRDKGVATALLFEAVRILKRTGARVIEGYPVKPKKKGEFYPPVFANTGTLPMFREAGFKPVGPRDLGKQRMRLSLR